MPKKYIFFTFAFLLALSLILFFFFQSLNYYSSPNESSNNTESTVKSSPETLEAKKMNESKSWSSPPQLTIDKSKKYLALFDTTEGKFTVELYADKTPITVNNFVFLAENKFYDGTIFHRVIKDFMIQGGDPNGNGTGGPGYRFDDEAFSGKYEKGVLAMANAGPNTNGSQFFIMHKNYDLSPNYVIFGKVIEGIETIDKIAEAKVGFNPNSGEISTPDNPVIINSIIIENN